MNLALTPEMQSDIEQEMASGRFTSPTAVVRAALLALADSTPADLIAFEETLSASLQEAGRGELHDETAARAHLASVRARL